MHAVDLTYLQQSVFRRIVSRQYQCGTVWVARVGECMYRHVNYSVVRKDLPLERTLGRIMTEQQARLRASNLRNRKHLLSAFRQIVEPRLRQFREVSQDRERAPCRSCIGDLRQDAIFIVDVANRK